MGIEYSESLEEATQIARAALPLVSQFALPANPVNYAVLYEYVAGQNPQLSEALDQLRENAKDLTDAQVNTLYRDFISNTDEQALKDVRKVLSGMIDSTQGSLDKVGQKSQTYEESLGTAARQLTDGKSTGVIDVVTRLIDETARMQTASRSLQEELAKTNEDLSSLRTDTALYRAKESGRNRVCTSEIR